MLLAGISLLLIEGPLHGPIADLEMKLYDLRVQAQAPREPSPELVFIAIDTASESALGALPWKRTVHARMIDLLTKAGAKAILMDVLFMGARSPEEDAALIEACRRSGRVVLARQLGDDWRPLPLVAGLEKVARAGCVSSKFPRNEPVRFLPLVHNAAQIQDTLALAIVGLELARGTEFVPEFAGDTGPTHMLNAPARLGGQTLPLINLGPSQRNLLALNPPGRPFHKVSFHEVLSGKVPAGLFEGKIVLVGASDDGNDRFASLRAEDGLPGEMPGALAVHGVALDTILSGKFITRPRFSLFGIPIHPFTLTWAAAVLILLGVTYLTHRLTPLWAVGSALAFTGILAGVAWWTMVHSGLWLFIMPLACSVWFPLLGMLVFDSVYSRSALKRFVPSHTNLEEIIRAPGALTRQETIEATIMFVDLRDYTTLSEGRDPDEVRRLVSRFHTALGELVQKHGGDVCDFQGDAQMVAFGLDGRKDHALAAIRAAREVPGRTQALNDSIGQQLFRAGVGICTGPVSVGYLEAGGKSQHTVLGDTTNTAARLQGKARDLGVVTVVSGTTVTSAGSQPDLRELPPVSLKGKAEPHPIFELIYP